MIGHGAVEPVCSATALVELPQVQGVLVQGKSARAAVTRAPVAEQDAEVLGIARGQDVAPRGLERLRRPR